jgi:hypothetical protein
MQGGTAERAFVVAWPEDLTAGWSYSALSRARGTTRLLIGDRDRRDEARAEVAPRGERRTPARSEVLARVARRMVVRDDEDLAVDQVTVAGREDDLALQSHRAARGSIPPELGASRAEERDQPRSLSRLIELREEIGRLRVVLAALPTRPLARFDELDTVEQQLLARRDKHKNRVAALAPRSGRVRRARDPDAEERAFLYAALELDDRALSEVRIDRARLYRELGIRIRFARNEPESKQQSTSGSANTKCFAVCSRNR